MNLPDKKTFFLSMLSEFEQHIGEGRFNDPAFITRILAVSGLPYAIGGVPVAFCDATLTFLGCKVLAVANGEVLTDENAVAVLKSYRPSVDKLYFATEASVGETQAQAVARGTWLSADAIGDDTDILPGWFILFDWGNGDHHIEMVRQDNGDEIDTDGANTSCPGHPSGMIARKQRDWTNVWGFYVTYKL